MLRFKSVFFRYMAAFILINILSFAVLSTTINVIVRSYGNDLKTKSLSSVANSAAMYIQNDYDTDRYDSFRSYLLNEGQDLKLILKLLAANDDNMLLFITDNSGQVIHFGGSQRVIISTEAVSNGSGRFYISGSTASELMKGSNISEKGDMDGFFKGEHAYYAIPLHVGDTYIGSIFASSNSTDVDSLVTTMSKTVIMSTLWIMLASLVAVYFITERMTAPIKDMSRAVQSFGSGQFDARVTVVGNDEVAELATAFNSMAEQVQHLEDMRRTFLANVSHDLRTPMTTISGFIDGILDGAIPPEKHEYYLGIIASEVRRLSRLVSQLLDISRIEAGERKFSPEIYDICEQGREIIINNMQRLEDKKLDVQFTCDSENMLVYADRDSIHQIFYNICDNAIKFSKEGGRYHIDVSERDKKVFVSVYNEGQGIPKEDLPYVFERFYKSDKSRGMDKTGVGLGLYIARTIIEAQGQKIWAESEPGEWCKSTFTLACAPVKNDRERSVGKVKSHEREQ